MVGISQSQRRLHILSEAAAVTLVAPFMFYVATRKELPSWARFAAAAIGVGTIVVDGYLLAKYVCMPAAGVGERFVAGEIGPQPIPEIVGLIRDAEAI